MLILKILIGIVVVSIILILGLAFFSFGPPGTPLGNTKSGFTMPHAKVKYTPEEALKAAEPYLEISYQLRRKKRGDKDIPSEKKPIEHISYHDNWYLISRDHYPSYTPFYYNWSAVKVNAQTLEVIPPE